MSNRSLFVCVAPVTALAAALMLVAGQAVAGPTTQSPALAPAYDAEGVQLVNYSSAQRPRPRRILFRFATTTTADQQTAALAQVGITQTVFTYEPLVPGLVCVATTPANRDLAIKSLSAMPGVLYAHRVHEVFALDQTTPYGIPIVETPAAWPTTRGSGTRIAVLDTGITIGHPDLPVTTQSFIAGQTVADVHSHGTHCAGTVLALDNTEGVVGVAPSADLVVGKVLSDAGSGDTAGVLAGINWAVQSGAKVISMSLGGGGFEQAFEDGCIAADAAGTTIVAAAGNDASDAPAYPAWYSDVISVGAIDSTMTRASFSNYGPKLTVCAPGVGVYSTSPGYAAYAVEFNGLGRAAYPLTGTAQGVVSGPVVFCGFGGTAADFPATVSGKIAHVRRGGPAGGLPVNFQTKATNAIAAGAIGVIISNNASGYVTNGTLNTNVSVPVVSISQADGDELQTLATTETVAITVNFGPPTYSYKSGTSMACPHVAGVAGLLHARFDGQGLTTQLVRDALQATAMDLGDPGRDDLYGAGLVDAAAALAWLPSHLITSCALADIASDSSDAAFNPNASVGPEDLEAFVNGYIAGASIADVASDSADTTRNPNGSVGPEDLEAFVNSFIAGC